MGHMGYDLGDGCDDKESPVADELTGSAKTQQEGSNALLAKRKKDAAKNESADDIQTP